MAARASLLWRGIRQFERPGALAGLLARNFSSVAPLPSPLGSVSTEEEGRGDATSHILATGVFLLATAGHAGAVPVSPAGISRAEGDPPIILVQDKATKDETLKHKVKRVWRNLTGYKFDVSCPFAHRSCTETGNSRDDARSKCIARNPVCWVADAQ
jgi:hypothetical protein